MAKLVLLSQGLTGRTHELTVDKTTIGRVEDNSFPITEPSVSSHHCEVLLRGAEVVVKDLNSTNGSYINGEKISESVLKPGQILRLGQVEMRLEVEGAPPPPGAKRPVDTTMLIQRGVSLTELEAGARTGFDTANKGFAKKDNKGNRLFLIGAIVVGVIIVVLILAALLMLKKSAAT
jgi:pSer/pThr/pTyr-binding forkhead associated (FHA) protein